MILRTKWALAIVLSLSIGNVAISAPWSTDTFYDQPLLGDQPETQWTLVQEVDGLLFYLSVVEKNQERFFSIRVENSNNESSDFIWHLTRHNQPVVITADEMAQMRTHLDAHASQTIDGTDLIYLGETDQISDFEFHVQLVKH